MEAVCLYKDGTYAEADSKITPRAKIGYAYTLSLTDSTATGLDFEPLNLQGFFTPPYSLRGVSLDFSTIVLKSLNLRLY